MMITYAVEDISLVRDEMEPLSILHWAELAGDIDEIPLDFDWELYTNLQALGKIMFTTVRDDGQLVGYHCALVSNHMHYKTTLHGIVDFLWIHPKFRRGFIGINLLKFVEDELRKRGVRKVIMSSKNKLDTSALLQRLGYNYTERIFTKVLD